MLRNSLPLALWIYAVALVPSQAVNSKAGTRPSGRYDLGATACETDADCTATGEGCFADGRCLCLPGFNACRDGCADVTSDPGNCGACGMACPNGQGCADATCQSILAINDDLPIDRVESSSAVTITTPFRVSPLGGASVCRGDAEAQTERAAVGGDADFFVTYNIPQVNWASDFDSWGTTELSIPVSTNMQVNGDPSASTSDFTGLNYASYISTRTDLGQKCVGIAASTSDDMDTNSWTYPLRCISSPAVSGADGPTIEYDIGGTDMYAAYINQSSQLWLQIMKQCKAGPVGCCVDATCTDFCSASAAEPCPVTQKFPLVLAPAGFATIAVNPCSHNALVAVPSGSSMMMKVVTPNGNMPATYTIQGSLSHSDNTGCSPGNVRACTGTDGVKCGDAGSSSCMSLVYRPSIVTTSTGGKCYAYVSWEFSSAGTDGKQYFTDRMEVWDVTDDLNAVDLIDWNGKSSSATWNHYGTTLAVSGTNVAWMKFSDSAGACANKIFAHGDTNNALSSLSDWGSIATGIPAMRYGGQRGFVELNATITRGVGAGGALFATWTQPVCNTDAGACYFCAASGSCPGNDWSFEVRGARITP